MANRIIDTQWEKIFSQLKILSKIQKHGFFKISSSEINPFHQSRLMAKFDNSVNLPFIFSENNLSILPISRGDYIIGNFDTYKKITPLQEDKPDVITFPSNIESIDYNHIYSESSALNCAYISGMLNEIIGEECLPTINGRMSTSQFNFIINNIVGGKNYKIDVRDSQCEIDGGYESDSYLMLIEAKNYIADDFLIRQVYYPYRLWTSKVKKEVIPVFFTFSNQTYTFYKIKFHDDNNYNSLEIIKTISFKIAPEEIEIHEIENILNKTEIIKEPSLPFPQANSFLRIIDLLGLLIEKDLAADAIKSNYNFDPRQVDYYTNAGIYLGIIAKKKTKDGVYYCLSGDGKKIMTLPYKQRYLELSRLILQHEVFNKTLKLCFKKSELPSIDEISEIMRQSKIYNVRKNSSTIERRAQTVKKWIDWILSLTEYPPNSPLP